jgi:hypothetical protein
MGSHRVFRAVDRFLTTRGVAAGRFAEAHSWRVGRSARTCLAVVHELVLASGRWLGLTSVESALVRSMQAVDAPAPPAFPGSVRSACLDPAEASDVVVRSICVDADGAPMAIESVSWQREPFPDRPSPARFLFHCLHWVSALLDAQSGRADDHCRQTAVLVVRRWIAECLHAERSELIWDLHVTALRALVLARVWAACRSAEAPGSSFMRYLAAALVRHADRLSTEACYQPTHNHGVTQAYALLAIGLGLRGHPDADGWVRLGRDRLQAQMAANVSEEGVHREHSPHYHFYVFKQFRDAIQPPGSR